MSISSSDSDPSEGFSETEGPENPLEQVSPSVKARRGKPKGQTKTTHEARLRAAARLLATMTNTAVADTLEVTPDVVQKWRKEIEVRPDLLSIHRAAIAQYDATINRIIRKTLDRVEDAVVNGVVQSAGGGETVRVDAPLAHLAAALRELKSIQQIDAAKPQHREAARAGIIRSPEDVARLVAALRGAPQAKVLDAELVEPKQLPAAEEQPK